MNGDAYEETYQTCPYDPAHRILRHRFITHLVRCRRNYSGKQTSVCPFNSTHVINTPEFKYHLDTCVNRNQVDLAVTKPADVGPKIAIDFGQEDIETDENWDNNVAPSYNPASYVESQPILRRLDTASRANRRQFHEAERRRFQEIDQSNQPPPARAARAEVARASVRAPPQPRGELPTEIAARLREVTLQTNDMPASLPSAQPPPLSEIITSARAPGAPRSEETWQRVPARGRGRGLRRNMN